MQSVYITTPGVTIHKVERHLVAKKDGEVHHTIFPFRTEQLVIFGGVEITRGAINLLLRHGIATVFLSQNGRYNGQLVPPLGKNVFLRKRQYERAADPEFCLALARAVISGKVRNQIVVLRRIKRFQKKDIRGMDDRLEQILKNIGAVRDINALRGMEGMAAKHYFSVFDLGFTKTQEFAKRIRRPPTDPVNAVLSLLYTILFYRIDNVLEKCGLDTYCGNFHSLSYGRKSLALDLMEEFRPIIVDTLVFSLFNMNIVAKNDFVPACYDDEREADETPLVKTGQSRPPGPDVLTDAMGVFESGFAVIPQYAAEAGVSSSLDDDGHALAAGRKAIILRQEALQKVLTNFERKLDTTFYYERLQAERTYRKVFDAQAEMYLETLRGDAANYIPLVMR